jgi:hypothetical protein
LETLAVIILILEIAVEGPLASCYDAMPARVTIMKRSYVYNDDRYSVHKPRRSSFRESARSAAIAMAEFWGALADGAADAVASATESFTDSCEGGAEEETSERVRTRHREGRFPSGSAQSASFAAASRYFEEMARIAQEVEAQDRVRSASEDNIDYERLAKAIVVEINRQKEPIVENTSRVG